MVITICNEKGGSGKSTIVINLASRFAQEKGCNLLLIDTDSQRSIETFTSIREYNGIKPTFSAITKLGSSLMKEIKSQVRSDIDFEMREKYADNVKTERDYIDAMKAVGVAYGKGQQPSTTNLMWLK